MRNRIGIACTSVITATFVAAACSTSLGSARRQAAVTPVHPTGPIPPAHRGALRGRVAYSTRDGDIWVMNANGSGRRRVTRSGPGFDFDPSLSPNGRSIVFRTSRGRYIRDPEGSAPKESSLSTSGQGASTRSIRRAVGSSRAGRPTAR